MSFFNVEYLRAHLKILKRCFSAFACSGLYDDDIIPRTDSRSQSRAHDKTTREEIFENFHGFSERLLHLLEFNLFSRMDINYLFKVSKKQSACTERSER